MNTQSENGFAIRKLADISTVPADSRICAAKWRNSVDAATKKEALATVVQVITDETMQQNFAVLAPHFRSFLEDTQDKILKSLLEENYGKTLVATSEIDIAAIVEYLDSSNESGRMTKETVGSWFDSVLADKLLVAFANRWGVSDSPTKEQEAKLMRALKAYRDKISSLAGTKTQFADDEKEQVKKALAFAQEDALARKFIARIDAMKDKAADLLDAL